MCHFAYDAFSGSIERRSARPLFRKVNKNGNWIRFSESILFHVPQRKLAQGQYSRCGQCGSIRNYVASQEAGSGSSDARPSPFQERFLNLVPLCGRLLMLANERVFTVADKRV